MVASSEKPHERVNSFLMSVSRRLAMSVTQICILMAFALPRKIFEGGGSSVLSHPKILFDIFCHLRKDIFLRSPPLTFILTKTGNLRYFELYRITLNCHAFMLAKFIKSITCIIYYLLQIFLNTLYSIKSCIC